MEDRSWMYRRLTPRGEIYNEFYNEVEYFLQFAYNSLGLQLNDLIRCPCTKCFNLSLMTREMVWDHLTKYGFMNAHFVWWAHGETFVNSADPWSTTNLGESSHSQYTHHDERNDFREMAYYAFCPDDDDNWEIESNFPNQHLDEEPNNQAKAFYDLLHASTIPLGSSERNETVLSCLSYMLHTKTANNITANGFNAILKGCRSDTDEVIHPAQSEAWRHFDEMHPSFKREPRYVRLGLATDRFNPRAHSSTTYSCWLVFLIVYNLPPEMCMRPEFTFLTMVIASPKNPGKNIYVFLRPLIEDLKMLWSNGVETYDSYRKQNFIMRAMLMWTITDFSGYGMVAGWSTHGQLSYPYCMEMTPCFFYCHHQFLPKSHSFRFDQSNFLKGRVELGSPPPRLDGVSMRHRVENLHNVLFGKPFENQTIEEGVTEVEVDANTSDHDEDYGEEKDSESSRNSDNVEDDDSDDSDDSDD
ncbi:hypothetical protein SLA2020_199330 [Shorea laevis]